MSNEDRAKTPRTLLVADHLWEAFATMAVEMGSERDALINQALYTFARLNGFLVPADLKRLAPPQPAPGGSGPRPVPVPPPSPRSEPPTDERPVARPMGNPERVAEIAQQLGSTPARAVPAPPPPPPVAGSVQVDDSLLGDGEEESLPTSMELPNLAQLGLLPNKAGMQARQPTPAPAEPEPTPSGSQILVLLSDGRELDRVVKDRFLIGRGKHCDLIINSGKVSREHAVITREGSTYYIEDLGSSNGTWFDKRRISRRQIQDGDEYYICSEKLSCTFR